METLIISLAEARAMQLAAQGLLKPWRRKANKADVLDSIQRMSALQIDTISVVARSPYLVLFSRLGAYEPVWLEQLLAEGALFEYWSHEACFLPIEDYVLYRPRMASPELLGWKYSQSWIDKNRDAVAALLTHIRQQGAVRSADFERKDARGGDGWWSWKPEKRSLEALFTTGELMVARRERFARVYDLRERVHPGWDDTRDSLPGDVCRQRLWLKAVKALGIAKASWIGDYFRTGRRLPEGLLEQLCAEGSLLKLGVEGFTEPFYCHAEHRSLLEQAARGQLQPSLTTVLSPFDPLVWDRRRALELFGFDYRLECYTPKSKRRYGYFVLPLLYRGRLVGRLDAKAHRKLRHFEIKAIYLEQGVKISATMVKEMAAALRRCAIWHETLKISIARSDPPEFAQALRDALGSAPILAR